MNAKSVIETVASERARLIERGLIFLMPFAFTGFFTVSWWILSAYVMTPITELQSAVSQIQRDDSKRDSQIQDHEARMVFGKAARESFQGETSKALEKIDTKIDTMSQRMGDVTVTLGALRATLNERLPARNQQTGMVDPDPCFDSKTVSFKPCP